MSPSFVGVVGHEESGNSWISWELRLVQKASSLGLHRSCEPNSAPWGSLGMGRKDPRDTNPAVSSKAC